MSTPSVGAPSYFFSLSLSIVFAKTRRFIYSKISFLIYTVRSDECEILQVSNMVNSDSLFTDKNVCEINKSGVLTLAVQHISGHTVGFG